MTSLRTTNYELRTTKAFTLIETLISIALLLVFAISTIAVSNLAAKSVTLSQQRDTANRYAREAMEAVYSIRAADFNLLSTGTFHPVYTGSGWTLTSGSETLGAFTRSITISSVMRDIGCIASVCDIVPGGGRVDPGTLKVQVELDWVENGQGKNVTQDSLITYWR